MRDSLERTLNGVTQSYLGFSIKKLNEDIMDKLEQPVLRFKVDINVPFKEAKKQFKKRFFSDLLKAHLGNISEVAKVTGLDRRSIHRAVKELGIDIDTYREEMISPRQYRAEVVDDVVRDSLDDFKDVIHPRKLNEIYQGIMQTEITQVPLREPNFDEAEKAFEKQYLETALRQYGSVTETAKHIGLRPETLFRKIKALSIA